MDEKSRWLEEAKKSREILLQEWIDAGSPKTFYEWLLEI